MKARNQDGTLLIDVPSNLQQLIEVPHHDSRELIYLAVLNMVFIDIFLLNIIGNGTPTLIHQRKWKMKAEVMCPSLS